jgi:conjugative transfer signal peptidase TraF
MLNLRIIRNNILIIGSISIVCWLLLYECVQHMYVNPSISDARGYYFAYKASKYSVNDRVLLCVRDLQRSKLLHQLGLLYESNKCSGQMPYLLKKIVAIPGDVVAITKDGVLINKALQPNSTYIKKYKHIALNPLQYPQKFRLKNSEYFVMGNSKHSYDSRYFGVIRGSDIYYKAILIYSLEK